MTTFSIPVTEYDCARPGNAMTPPLQPFMVNDRQLVVAMVRSTLTVNCGRASRKYMAAIVRPTMQFLLDWNRAPDLRVSSHFLHVLRDFSATTRVGELAQGVSYAYWKWQRGYSWIADFGSSVDRLAPGYAGTKSPDFVMLNPVTKDVAVMESKGTGAGCHKSAMGYALRQCKDAVKHSVCSRGFGSVLTLDSGNPSGIATLHVRDPEGSAEFTEEQRHYLFRSSYASWFELAGDDELANWCRGGSPNGMNIKAIRQRIRQEQQYARSPLRVTTATALGFDADRTRFEIDPMIAEAIADINAFKNADWQKLFLKAHESPPNAPRSMSFPDGTLIIEH